MWNEFCGTVVAVGIVTAINSFAPVSVPFTVTPQPPADIPGGARTATVESAAEFAWRDFIALNWPAAVGLRDVPDLSADLRLANRAPRVWETFRGRVEVYPGIGRPFDSAHAAGDYGYDRAPKYVYDAERIGAASGDVQACAGGAPQRPPWNNLDEANQQNVRAGLSPREPWPGQQLLIESKVNRLEYVYVAARGWYGQNSIRLPRKRTGDYVRQYLNAPPPPAHINDPTDTTYISLPVGTIEVKAAWRRLGPADNPRHIYVNRVRYYKLRDMRAVCYIDSDGPESGTDRWGLVALHVMHKTPSAPYFIWSTFEHLDTLVADHLDAAGHIIRLEDANGAVTAAGSHAREAFTPDLQVAPAASPTGEQEITADPAKAITPGMQLYFHQEAIFDVPEVKYVGINRRLSPIPEEIIDVNRRAHAAIRAISPDSPLQYYRLVSVQWAPLDKPPVVDYTGPYPPAIYYAANLNIEAPPVNQHFSGQFVAAFTKSSDFLNDALPFFNPKPNPRAPVFANVFDRGTAYLAGGCMGCHGFRQAYGTDWSFLLDRQRVPIPGVKPEGGRATE
jgi:hypothetical protein